TGANKKMLIAAAAYRGLWASNQEIYGISDQSVVNVSNFGAWTGVGHKYAVSTWAAGGAVILGQRPNYYEAFDHPGITHTYTQPAMLMRILAAPRNRLRRNDAMRVLVTGGPVSQALADETKARLSRRLYTFFSCTEAGPVTLTPIEQPEDL